MFFGHLATRHGAGAIAVDFSPLQLKRACFILKSALSVCVAQFEVPFVLIVAFIYFVPALFTPPCLTPPLMLSAHIQSCSN